MLTMNIKTIGYTTFALLAFAGNSVLCRLALGEGQIDAASFTVIRLLSGIITLVIILKLAQLTQKNTRSTSPKTTSKGSWSAALMLFVYAIAFSYAYVSLDTGTGALILFGAVQITMLLVGILSGNRLHYVEWIGVATAFCGFVYLVLPSVSTPSLTGFILMTVAGIAWAFYTLKGRGSKHPLGDTSYNFLRTLPLVAILLALTIPQTQLSQTGILLAVVSGAVTSGIGYTLWYIALGGLTPTQAAVLQLLVPIIAAIGGVVFAGELISARLVVASALVLGGILLVVLSKPTSK
ncbi:MAG: DMT family transporter [Algicola sp.]|nr:DMT family transporter [Algicola sp.]